MVNKLIDFRLLPDFFLENIEMLEDECVIIAEIDSDFSSYVVTLTSESGIPYLEAILNSDKYPNSLIVSDYCDDIEEITDVAESMIKDILDTIDIKMDDIENASYKLISEIKDWDFDDVIDKYNEHIDHIIYDFVGVIDKYTE